MTLIIGLAGRAGSGKSTCAQWLESNYGAIRYSFAQPLKMLARELFDFTDEQVFGTQSQKEAIDLRWGMSPRQLLIKLGDGARRHVADDIWIRGVLRSIELDKPSIAVIEDIRYSNEAEAIHRAGGIVVRLRCPDAESIVDPDAPSERGVDEIDPHHVAIELSIRRSEGARDLLREFSLALIPQILMARR